MTYMMTNSSRIGAHLKSERKLAGMTQQQAADVLGVSRRTIGHWESGSHDIGARDLLALLYEYSSRRPDDLPTISLDDIFDFRPARFLTESGHEVPVTARDEEHLNAVLAMD